jgi:hypothetical protein
VQLHISESISLLSTRPDGFSDVAIAHQRSRFTRHGMEPHQIAANGAAFAVDAQDP